MADSLFDLELPDDGDRVSLIGAPAEDPASSRASASRARSARSASRAPLAVRMRPRTIDEVLGRPDRSNGLDRCRAQLLYLYRFHSFIPFPWACQSCQRMTFPSFRVAGISMSLWFSEPRNRRARFFCSSMKGPSTSTSR